MTANQGEYGLLLSHADGVTTRYAYDAAGRLVREGSKTYRYGWLDKVTAVVEGDRMATYEYHADGQLAQAIYAPGHSPASESFEWDGLALVRRGDEHFINEPHVGGGKPVASLKGTSYFSDMLGTTVGAKRGGKYSASALTAFGENLSVDSPTPTQNSNFFTGKPYVFHPTNVVLGFLGSLSMKYILCCLSAFVCAESIAAYTYTYVTNVIDDVVLTYRIDGHEAVVLQAGLPEPQSLDVRKTVAIPETVAGTKVRAVAGGTFNASHWLQSVTIPASVTQIGMNAFANCSNLVSVNIEHDGKSFGLSRINSFAFGNCASLVDINLTNAIHLSMIDRGAFSGCKSLEFIALPECCRRLDEFVFRGCENLREVMLPVTVEEVPGSAFIECVRLREIKIAPGGNFLFENGVLYDKTKRKLVRCLLGDHVQSVKIEEGIMGIMPNAFGGCKHLKNVILPSTLKHIGEFAFCGSGLKEIVLPEGLENIGYAAFADTTVKLDGRWVHVNEL